MDNKHPELNNDVESSFEPKLTDCEKLEEFFEEIPLDELNKLELFTYLFRKLTVISSWRLCLSGKLCLVTLNGYELKFWKNLFELCIDFEIGGKPEEIDLINQAFFVFVFEYLEQATEDTVAYIEKFIVEHLIEFERLRQHLSRVIIIKMFEYEDAINRKSTVMRVILRMSVHCFDRLSFQFYKLMFLPLYKRPNGILPDLLTVVVRHTAEDTPKTVLTLEMITKQINGPLNQIVKPDEYEENLTMLHKHIHFLILHLKRKQFLKVFDEIMPCLYTLWESSNSSKLNSCFKMFTDPALLKFFDAGVLKEVRRLKELLIVNMKSEDFELRLTCHSAYCNLYWDVVTELELDSYSRIYVSELRRQLSSNCKESKSKVLKIMVHNEFTTKAVLEGIKNFRGQLEDIIDDCKKVDPQSNPANKHNEESENLQNIALKLLESVINYIP